MPRPPKGSWSPHRRRYEAALGDWYEDVSGRWRRRVVPLLNTDGSPVAKGDRAGHASAMGRLLREAASTARPDLGPTTAEVMARWLRWHRDDRKSRESTLRGHRRAVERAINVPWGTDGERIGDIPADQFGVEHLMAVRSWLRANGGVDGSIRNHDSVIFAAFRWAAQAVEGREPLVMLARNPFPKGSVRTLRPYRSDRACPSWDDLCAILDRLDAHVERTERSYGEGQRRWARVNALWVRVIGERGCRPIEVAELRVEHWAGTGFELARHKMSGKTGLVGVIPLGEATARRVASLIGDPCRVGPWVFGPQRSEEQGPPKVHSLDAWWAKNRAAVGAGQYELYSFRNCVSNHLRLRGVGGRELQLAMRHSSEVADGPYRRDLIGDAAEVFRRAGL